MVVVVVVAAAGVSEVIDDTMFVYHDLFDSLVILASRCLRFENTCTVCEPT